MALLQPMPVISPRETHDDRNNNLSAGPNLIHPPYSTSTRVWYSTKMCIE